MNKYYDLTDVGDSQRKILDVDIATKQDRIWTIGNNDDHLDYVGRMQHDEGYDITRGFRRIAHLDLGTVRLLAVKHHDQDAIDWLQNDDADARDRLIEKYPQFFKACSGGI